MKSGAGDDPFAEDSTDADSRDDSESEAETESDADSGTTTSNARAESRTTPNSAGETQTQSLPYKYRRDSVKQGRNQQPVFLQSSTEELIEETLNRIEGRFDETIYKTDVVEAMLVAGGEETTPEAVLERWGYGLKNR